MRIAGVIEQLRISAGQIVDPGRPPSSLGPALGAATRLLAELGAPLPPPSADAADGVRTADGLALAPALAADCAGDVVRTVQFLRGIHAAIRDLRRRNPARPVRILYAGCGPYGMLAVPLMPLFSAQEVRFTLLDIHAASVDSVRAIVDALGLGDRVAACVVADAAAYRIAPGMLPDLIVLEMLQAGLEAEPQVAVTRQLLAQAPDAVLIPEEIRLDLALVDPAVEFAGAGAGGPAAAREHRIGLGSVFVLDRAAVASWAGIVDTRLPGAVVALPEMGRRLPMLFTRIRVYRGILLDDHDSGLTAPRVFPLPAGSGPGAVVDIRYELGPHPRLLALRGAGSSGDEVCNSDGNSAAA